MCDEVTGVRGGGHAGEGQGDGSVLNYPKSLCVYNKLLNPIYLRGE